MSWVIASRLASGNAARAWPPVLAGERGAEGVERSRPDAATLVAEQADQAVLELVGSFARERQGHELGRAEAPADQPGGPRDERQCLPASRNRRHQDVRARA